MTANGRPAGAFPSSGVPRGKGKALTVQTRAQELADMQAQGIKITQGHATNTYDRQDAEHRRRSFRRAFWMPRSTNAATRYNVHRHDASAGMGKAAAGNSAAVSRPRGGTGEWDGRRPCHATADLQEPPQAGR